MRINSITIVVLVFLLALGCNSDNKKIEDNFILGFTDFRIGSEMSSYSYCQEFRFEAGEEYCLCSVEYPKTKEINSELFSIQLKFHRDHGLESFDVNYFYEEFYENMITDAYGGLVKDEVYSDGRYYYSDDYTFLDFKNGLYFSILKGDGSVEDLIRQFGGNDDKIRTINVKITVRDFEGWQKVKSELTKERLLYLEAVQLYKTSERVRNNSNVQTSRANDESIFKEMFVIFDMVNVRTEPYLNSEVVFQLRQGDVVGYSGQTSSRKDKIVLRGKLYDDVWKKIDFRGESGWIYGPMISEVERQEITDFVIIPGKSFGGISFTSSINDILRQLDPKDVTIADDDIFDKPTVLYQGTDQELQIEWSSDLRTQIYSIGFYKKDSKWRISSGIRIGDNIDRLEKINGRPFIIYGPNPDFRTHVGSWEGGNLNKNVIPLFHTDELDAYGLGKYLVEGGEYLSTSDEVQKSNLIVDGVIILNK